MVKSIADNQVPRTQLSKMLEKLATEAFPDRADPVQQSAWDQYIRVANEVIGQVMQNCHKIIMEVKLLCDFCAHWYFSVLLLVFYVGVIGM